MPQLSWSCSRCAYMHLPKLQDPRDDGLSGFGISLAKCLVIPLVRSKCPRQHRRDEEEDKDPGWVEQDCRFPRRSIEEAPYQRMQRCVG